MYHLGTVVEVVGLVVVACMNVHEPCMNLACACMIVYYAICCLCTCILRIMSDARFLANVQHTHGPMHIGLYLVVRSGSVE